MSDQNPSVRDLTPEEVARGLAEGRMVLVDVREPNETALERFPGAVIVPLSAFDPAAIPEPEGREVVFACRSGPPLGDGFARGAGAGLCLRLASRRRNFGVEGRRPADRDVKGFRGVTMPAAPRRAVAAFIAVARRALPLAAVPVQAVFRGAHRARRQFLQLVGLSGPDGARRLHQGNRHQGPLRHVRFQRHAGGEAAGRAIPAMTSWCRPVISWRARSRPASFRSSTSPSCPTSSMPGRRSRTGSPSTIPATSTPSITCGARPASATT